MFILYSCRGYVSIQCLIDEFPKQNIVTFNANQAHKFIISIRFSNINEDVKDIILRFNYAVIINDNSPYFNNIVTPMVVKHNGNNNFGIGI